MRAQSLLGVGALLLGNACAISAPPPAPPSAPPPRVNADALFVRGAFTEAIAEYDEQLRRDPHPRSVAQNQFLRAMARLASGNSEQKRRAREELWRLEHEHAGSLWGTLARAHLAEIARGTVLRQAVQQAGVDLHVARERVAELEAELLRIGDENAELQVLLASTREERAKLQRRFDDALEHGKTREERVRELENELSALKRIDMERQP